MRKIIFILLSFGIGIPCLKAQDTISLNTTNPVDTITSDDKASGVLNAVFAYYIKENKKAKTKTSKLILEIPFRFGFILGNIQNSEVSLISGNSINSSISIRSGYKFTDFYALTFGYGMTWSGYTIKNGVESGALKLPPFSIDDPDYVIHGESYLTMSVDLFVGSRFYFGPKSKMFVELEVYGSYNPLRNYSIVYYGPGETMSSFSYSDPDSFIPFEAGVQLEFAPLRWFSVWGRYKMTNSFYAKFSDAELPKFSAGISLTL